MLAREVSRNLRVRQAISEVWIQLYSQISSRESASNDDIRDDFASRSVLLQQCPKSLRPTLQIFSAAERNNHGKNFFRGRRHHGALGIAGRAAVRPDGIGEERQSFQIQIVLADAFVRFPGFSR